MDPRNRSCETPAIPKALGTINPADLFTKYLAREVSAGHCGRLNLQFRSGRADAAPQLNVLLKAIFDYDFDDDDPEPGDHDYDMTTQLQATINHLWHHKCKAITKPQPTT